MSFLLTQNMMNIPEQKQYVVKRNGEKEEVSFDKIARRIKFLSSGLTVNPVEITQKVISQIIPDISTSDLDVIASDECIKLSTISPDYGVLASRIIVSNHHKNTTPSFSEAVEILHNNKNSSGQNASLINDEVYQIVMENKNKINDVIQHDRDYRHDYFGFKTLEKSYLLRSNRKIIERPQYMWMRVALGIHRNDFKDAIQTYDLMSQGYFTQATPTLFNAGTRREQLSSCFLLTMKEDSIDGIYDTLKQCALISQYAGGIGVSVHNVRSLGSYISGTGGTSNGLVPMLKVFNYTARYVDQCFHPETFVYTTSGPKKFNQLIEGVDEIINKNGEAEVIDKVLEHHYEGSVYNIEVNGTTTIVTDQHPILCIKKSDTTNLYDFKSAEWIEVKDLRKGDAILKSIPQYCQDIETITEEDCYMYGLLLCQNMGQIMYECKFEKPQPQSWWDKLRISPKKPKRVRSLDYLTSKVESYFNNKVIEYNRTEDDTYITYKWKPNPSVPIKYSDYNETISSRFINLPVHKVKQILNGIIDKYGIFNITEDINLPGTNKQVKEAIKYMFLRLGVVIHDYNTKYQNYLGIPINNVTQNDIEYKKNIQNDNLVYGIISDIQENNTTMSGIMYDLELKKEHNYLTHLGLAHNGGGKRFGSFAMYIEMHHPDILHFLEMKKNTGSEDNKARDLFYALWVSDLFMERVQNNDYWTLLDPNEFPGLCDVYGEDYSNLYHKYEKEFKLKYKHNPDELNKKVLKAQDIWYKIIEAQVETGTPYMSYKDAVNRKNNQANLGTIRSSNLCNEINLYTSPEEVAVCNLASVALPKFVDVKNKTFDFDKLRDVVKVVTKNLNKVIDVNFYPVPEAKNSNLKHRPIGIGVQGLADVFALMRYPFESPEAKQLNRQIAEHMYLAGVEASMEISKKRDVLIKELIKLVNVTYNDWSSKIVHKTDKYVYNLETIEAVLNQEILETKYKQTIKEWLTAEQLAKSIGLKHSGLEEYESQIPILTKMRRIFELLNVLKLIPEELDRQNYYGSYSSFIGSPLHQGKLQYDLWNQTPSGNLLTDFNQVKADIQKYGLRNSTLFAYMPTASTAQILGNNECFEPYTSNIYSRKVLSGQHTVINKHLIKDLQDLGLWSKDLKDMIIADQGSVQNIESIPNNIKQLYKTVWEIKQKTIIDYASDRAPFICQTQSMNLFISNPTYGKMSSMHFYAWKKGLKTGMYYLRTQTKADANKFTIDPEVEKRMKQKRNESQMKPVSEVLACSRDNPDCEACGA